MGGEKRLKRCCARCCRCRKKQEHAADDMEGGDTEEDGGEVLPDGITPGPERRDSVTSANVTAAKRLSTSSAISIKDLEKLRKGRISVKDFEDEDATEEEKLRRAARKSRRSSLGSNISEQSDEKPVVVATA